MELDSTRLPSLNPQTVKKTHDSNDNGRPSTETKGAWLTSHTKPRPYDVTAYVKNQLHLQNVTARRR